MQRQTYGYTAGAYNVGFEIDGEYIAVFHAYPPMFLVENDDMITIQWMIFKKIWLATNFKLHICLFSMWIN